MKRLLTGFIFLSCAGSLSANEGNFEGAWQLISGEYVNHKGELVNYKDLQLSSIKIITNGHFSFVTMSGDKFWSSGTGKFEATESEYIETPIHTSYHIEKGTQYVFKYQLESDTLTSKRIENGKQVELEVWKKIDN